MSPETNAIIFKIVIRQIFLSSSNPGLVSLELVVVEPWLSSPFTAACRHRRIESVSWSAPRLTAISRERER